MSTCPPLRKTILFSGHDHRFLRPFIRHCEENPKYRVLLDEHPGHEPDDLKKCRQLLAQADVIFCEWCLGNAVWYSQHKLPHQTLIVRLHSQEMRLPYLDRIAWQNVHALILICPRNLNLIRERYPFLTSKTHLTYNPIPCRELDQPKLPGAEFNLGLMGICPSLKAPHLAFEILAGLKRMDRRFTLFIKGRPPQEYDWLWNQRDQREYYENFLRTIRESPYADSVVFETYGEDVPLWFSKIGFILSTSETEGSHQAVAEGMASGSIPIIRDWLGSELIYPPKYIAGTVAKAVAAVQKWRTPEAYSEEVEFCRRYALDRFDQNLVCTQLEALFAGSPPRLNPVLERAEAGEAAAPTPPQVLILGYIPPGFQGGYRIRIHQEISVLRKLGLTVHFACLHPATAGPAELASLRTELERWGCPIHLVAIHGFFDIKFNESNLQAPLAALEQITRDHHLSIVHAEALYCARIGLLLKERSAGLRLVFDCHGTSPEEERMSGAHPSRISAIEYWEGRIAAGSDLLVFVSEAMSRYYRLRYPIEDVPTVVVPCCITDERFPSTRKPSLPDLPSNRPILVYLGSLAAWQCGEEMIRLFSQLHRREPRLFFLLLVPAGDHAKARQLLAHHGLPETAVRLTELPHDQVAAALKQAHVGVLLRRTHPVNQVSSPTKFGEYLAAGLPVLMTDGIGDFSQLAQEKGVGVVLAADLLEQPEYPESEVTRLLEFIRRSQEQQAKLGTICRNLARRTLHWDAAAATLAQAYRRHHRAGHPRQFAHTDPAAVPA